MSGEFNAFAGFFDAFWLLHLSTNNHWGTLGGDCCRLAIDCDSFLSGLLHISGGLWHFSGLLWQFPFIRTNSAGGFLSARSPNLHPPQDSLFAILCPGIAAPLLIKKQPLLHLHSTSCPNRPYFALSRIAHPLPHQRLPQTLFSIKVSAFILTEYCDIMLHRR
ncbi:hypothetical protein SAMN05518684_107130 [Salipaludibacillus aurantiacus]|uniref:Uncharacterized protein n=1 Tax=Salipaludibacillus aurantiacus TaxID=1601833 RepID=A0A1H9UCE6_9BACI|nr:hypothetical protein SAMN05518684_107130 [Salipaludibacillus aurantiacus]